MIQANELRIGNLVNIINRSNNVHIAGTIPFKIMGINQFDCNVIMSSQNVLSSPGYLKVNISDISPISITHEILEKCKNIITIKDKERLSITYQYLDYTIIQMRRGYWLTYKSHPVLNKKIFTLHEFQNIIFLLTGQELKVNL